VFPRDLKDYGERLLSVAEVEGVIFSTKMPPWGFFQALRSLNAALDLAVAFFLGRLIGGRA